MSDTITTGDQTPATMRAVVVSRPGGLEALEIRDMPVPAREPGWVLIAVRAFGVNESEVTTRKGESDAEVTYPRVPGIEAVGVVAGADAGSVGGDEARVAEVEVADFAAIFDALPTPYLVLDTDLRMVAANRAREEATGVPAREVVRQYLFDAFPDDPEDRDAQSTSQLRASPERVIATGRPGVMPVQRDNVPDALSGFGQRWWSPSTFRCSTVAATSG